MKKIIILILTVIISGSFFVSCDKSAPEPDGYQNQINENSVNPIFSPENRQAIINTAINYMKKEDNLKGAEFIPPFFTLDGFFLLSDDMMQLVSFSTILDENDFYRENPDGTVTVHISSNNALAELADFTSGEMQFYIGEKGHMIMNYTGFVEIVPVYDDYGNIIGYLNFVVPDENSPATVWHGNSKVQLDGMGPKLNLIAHMTASAGWINVSTSINLN